MSQAGHDCTTCGSGSGACGSHAFGMITPSPIKRAGPSRPVKLSPDYVIPTLAHIEITYACMEDCVICYNPVRTTVNKREKKVVVGA